MKVKNYRGLIAWQKAMDLVEEVYRATREFPGEEVFALSGQLRRAVVSIPSNVAEGQGRWSTKEFLHHLSISYGSLREVETQVLIAYRLKYIPEAESERLLGIAGEVGRLLNGLRASLAR